MHEIERLDAREFNEWRAFDLISGAIGAHKPEILAAQIVQAIFNSQRAKGSPAVKLKDVLLSFNQLKDDPQEQADRVAEVVRAAMTEAMAAQQEANDPPRIIKVKR